MGVDFDGKELLLIHGHFCNEIKKLEELKSVPSCPIDKKTINQQIKLFSTVTNRIETAYPQLAKLKND